MDSIPLLHSCIKCRSYHGITCLIQIAVRRNGLLGSFPYESTDYVIDCIALWGHIGPALGALFADPDVLKVGLHIFKIK